MTAVRGRRVFLSGGASERGGGEAARALVRARDTLVALGATEVTVPRDLVPDSASPAEGALMSLNELTSCVEEVSEGRLTGRIVPYYDMLVSLPGWEGDPIARREREVAVLCGIECHDLAEVAG